MKLENHHHKWGADLEQLITSSMWDKIKSYEIYTSPHLSVGKDTAIILSKHEVCLALHLCCLSNYVWEWEKRQLRFLLCANKVCLLVASLLCDIRTKLFKQSFTNIKNCSKGKGMRVCAWGGGV